jgi:hypothetical protein
VFRSLAEDADTESEILEGTYACWFQVCPVGLTLDQAAELARVHSGQTVTVLRDLTPEDFRGILRDTNNPQHRYVILGRACTARGGAGSVILRRPSRAGLSKHATITLI